MIEKTDITAKKPRVRFWAFFFAFISLLLFLLLWLVMLLPAAVEKQVGKLLDRFSTNDAFTLQVKYIGLYRTEFSLLAAEESKESPAALRIISCSIAYRPLRLLKGELDKIELDGVRLALDLRPGKPLLPLLQLLPKQAKKEDAPEQKLSLTELLEKMPLRFSQLRLLGELLLRTEEEFIPVGIELLLRPGSSQWGYSLEISHALNHLRLHGSYHLLAEQLAGQLLFSAQSAALPQSLRLKMPAELTAELDSQGSFGFDLNKLKLSTLQAEINTSLHYQRGNVLLACRPRLLLNTEENLFALKVQGLAAQLAGRQLNLRQLEARFSPIAPAEINGQLQVEIEKQSAVDASFRVHRENEKILFSANGRPELGKDEFAFELDGNKIIAKNLQFAIAAELSPDLQYQVSASCAATDFSSDPLCGKLGSASFEVQGNGASAQMRASLRDLASVVNDIDLSIPELRCQADFQDGAIRGKCQLLDGSAKLDKQEIAAKFTGEIPLQWPLPEQASTEGFLQIKQLLGKGEKLGRLEGKFRLAEKQISFLANADLRGLETELEATCFPFAANRETFIEAEIIVPEQSLPENLLPAQYLPQLMDFNYAGKIKAGGKFTQSKNAVPRAEVFLKINDGQLRNQEKGFSLDGFRLECNLPELPKIASAGNQLLVFRNLEFGKFAIRSGRLRFRMESPSSWHLEGLSMNWCEGKLKLDSTRVNPENKRTSLFFYCDRLRLSALLQQLGAGLDEGEGHISGTIPIVINNEGLRFRDAFLYSTPGETGTIKLTPSRSISDTAAASTQLAFALDALANFNYSWVKLTLNSEKEQLKIKLQTDGRPASKLYYIPKDGTLVRSEVPNDFTGLQLDANLNIPLNNTLQVYQNLKQLFAPQ